MKILFCLTHTLYAKALIPLIVRLAGVNEIFITKNRPEFLGYSPRICGANPASNRFVNKSAFDYTAGIIGYGQEWSSVRDKIKFVYLGPKKPDVIIGTTKDLKQLGSFKKNGGMKGIFAIGYQHMPFCISLRDNFIRRNMPQACEDVFIKTNMFSGKHRFREYISGRDVSFRGFPYLDKIYSNYSTKMTEDKKKAPYVLIFHPGGYRGIVSKRGDNKKTSYNNQRDLINTVCRPVLKRGLVPVIKVHPLAARFHFKEDITEILRSLSIGDKDFSKVIVEDRDYYKYAYKAEAVITFGSSGIYELFSMGIKKILILGLFGRNRSDKFSIFNGIYIDSKKGYDNFWKRDRESFFKEAYRKGTILDKVYTSYSTLFTGNNSEEMIKDMGLGEVR